MQPLTGRSGDCVVPLGLQRLRALPTARPPSTSHFPPLQSPSPRLLLVSLSPGFLQHGPLTTVLASISAWLLTEVLLVLLPSLRPLSLELSLHCTRAQELALDPHLNHPGGSAFSRDTTNHRSGAPCPHPWRADRSQLCSLQTPQHSEQHMARGGEIQGKHTLNIC